MGVAGAAGCIDVPAGGDTQASFLPDDPRVPRPGADPLTLPRTPLTSAGLIGRTARHLVAGYSDHHGLPQRTEAARIIAVLPRSRRARGAVTEKHMRRSEYAGYRDRMSTPRIS
ncbi:hypothetical protein [Streptomyces sp. NPDC046942]|uniref:hypothetical protein n=1 Tax=Streptomyces sp. NPDC046942 TaxID=3155137 RepID=UPI0033C66286